MITDVHYLFRTAEQLIVLKTANTPVVTEREGEPCGAAEPLEIGNAVAAMNPQRPEHHEHAGEAAVPGEGLLHMWNLPSPEEAQSSKRNVSTNSEESTCAEKGIVRRLLQHWARRREREGGRKRRGAHIDAVRSAR